MVDYSVYRFNDFVNQELKKIKVNYVFQPIFDRKKRVIAYEALMRPEDCTVQELINRYELIEKLHILEVATLFGVFQEYERRNFDKFVCLNSFPTENLTEWENKLFNESFCESKKNVVVELMDYPEECINIWEKKKHQLQMEEVPFVMDGFNVGVHGVESIKLYRPHMVKLDRQLISNIDKDEVKQLQLAKYMELLRPFDVKIIAVGIESKDEYAYLKKVGIDYFQGYYLGGPE